MQITNIISDRFDVIPFSNEMKLTVVATFQKPDCTYERHHFVYCIFVSLEA